MLSLRTRDGGLKFLPLLPIGTMIDIYQLTLHHRRMVAVVLSTSEA